MFCPHCDGSIYKAHIVPLNVEVYLCDICESLWHMEDAKSLTKPSMDNLETFLERHGLNYMRTKIENLGYDWDKSILDNNVILCPRCGSKGIVYQVKIGALGMIVYFCDNCNGLWHEGQKLDTHSAETLVDFLASKGLDYSTAQLSDFRLDWAKKK